MLGMEESANQVFRANVVNLWLKGLTYSEVAKQVGVSRQRVQQIVRPPAAVYKLVRDRAKSSCEDCGVALSGGHVHHDNRGPETFNDPENLMYLCPSCHRWRHSSNRDLQTCQSCQGRLSERWVNGWGFTKCGRCKKIIAGAPRGYAVTQANGKKTVKK